MGILVVNPTNPITATVLEIITFWWPLLLPLMQGQFSTTKNQCISSCMPRSGLNLSYLDSPSTLVVFPHTNQPIQLTGSKTAN